MNTADKDKAEREAKEKRERDEQEQRERDQRDALMLTAAIITCITST